jgi:hypothetical protein
MLIDDTDKAKSTSMELVALVLPGKALIVTLHGALLRSPAEQCRR